MCLIRFIAQALTVDCQCKAWMYFLSSEAYRLMRYAVLGPFQADMSTGALSSNFEAV
jgi:hypothetical protein